MKTGDIVRIISTLRFGLIVNCDLIKSHDGVTVLTYCDFIKIERPQWFKCEALTINSNRATSLSEDLEEIIKRIK